MSEERSKIFTMEDLYRMASRDPMETFDKWPILEVRKKCLGNLKRREVDDCYADWVEKVILEPCICSYYDGLQELKESMLEWYVFNTRGDTVVRTIEFALSLAGASRLSEGVISKFVVGRLLKNYTPDLYSRLSSLPKFFDELLDELNSPYRGDHRYFNSEWINAERALRVIVNERDFSFLTKIEELIRLLKEDKILPPAEPFYAKAIHLATLKDARRILLNAKKES